MRGGSLSVGLGIVSGRSLPTLRHGSFLVGRYDFVKVGIGAVELDVLDGRTRQYKVEEEIYVRW